MKNLSDVPDPPLESIPISRVDLSTVIEEALEAMAVVTKYKKDPQLSDKDPFGFRMDLVKLSALNMNIGIALAEYGGNSKMAEESMRLSRASAWSSLKKKKQNLESETKEVYRATERDIELRSREMSKQTVSLMSRMMVYGDFYRQLYFSIRDFVSLGNDILKRRSSESLP